jgi:hypothetical protein
LFVEFGDRWFSAPGGEFHRRVREPGVDVDAAEPPPRDRVGYIRTQRFVSEAVVVFEDRQPQTYVP